MPRRAPAPAASPTTVFPVGWLRAFLEAMAGYQFTTAGTCLKEHATPPEDESLRKKLLAPLSLLTASESMYHTMTYLSISPGAVPSFDAITSMYQHASAELRKLRPEDTTGTEAENYASDGSSQDLMVITDDLTRLVRARLCAISCYQELARSSVAPDLAAIHHTWTQIPIELGEHPPHHLLQQLYSLTSFEIDAIGYYMESMLALGRSDFKDAVVYSFQCKEQLVQWSDMISTVFSPDHQMSRLFNWAQLAHQALLAKVSLYFRTALQQAEDQAGGDFQLATRCNPDFTGMIDNFASHADVSVLLLRESTRGPTSLQYTTPDNTRWTGLEQWPIIFSSSHTPPSRWTDRDHLPNIVSLVTASEQLKTPHLQCVECHHEPALGVSYCLAQVEQGVYIVVISLGKPDPDDHDSIQDFVRYMLIRLRHLHVYAQLRSNSVGNASHNSTNGRTNN